MMFIKGLILLLTENSTLYEKNRTKISFIFFLIMAACAVLARVCGYFYSSTATDIVYMETLLPAVLYYLSVIFDILLMFIGY